MIRDIANDTACHYDKKHKAKGRMQLQILSNDEGIYEFIE